MHKSRTENGNGGATPPPGYRAIHARTTAYRTRRAGTKRAHTVTGTSHAGNYTAPDGATKEITLYKREQENRRKPREHPSGNITGCRLSLFIAATETAKKNRATHTERKPEICEK